jgi:hypothetical protein
MFLVAVPLNTMNLVHEVSKAVGNPEIALARLCNVDSSCEILLDPAYADQKIVSAIPVRRRLKGTELISTYPRDDDKDNTTGNLLYHSGILVALEDGTSFLLEKMGDGLGLGFIRTEKIAGGFAAFAEQGVFYTSDGDPYWSDTLGTSVSAKGITARLLHTFLQEQPEYKIASSNCKDFTDAACVLLGVGPRGL